MKSKICFKIIKNVKRNVGAFILESFELGIVRVPTWSLEAMTKLTDSMLRSDNVVVSRQLMKFESIAMEAASTAELVMQKYFDKKCGKFFNLKNSLHTLQYLDSGHAL